MEEIAVRDRRFDRLVPQAPAVGGPASQRDLDSAALCIEHGHQHLFRRGGLQDLRQRGRSAERRGLGGAGGGGGGGPSAPPGGAAGGGGGAPRRRGGGGGGGPVAAPRGGGPP